MIRMGVERDTELDDKTDDDDNDDDDESVNVQF